MASNLPAAINNSISVAADFVLLTCAVLITVGIYRWIRSHAELPQSSEIIRNLGRWIGFAVVLRVGYFQPGRLIAPEGEYQHELIFEWRWAVLLIAAMGAMYCTKSLFESIYGEVGVIASTAFYCALSLAGASFAVLVLL